MKYEDAVHFLKNSLIFQMSLGSKELFHSNVWWWLINNDNEFIKVFVPDFDISDFDCCGSIRSEREKFNRDILIWLEDKNGNKTHIVIENKIKTLPTIEQLEKYTENLEKYTFRNGVLTGIGECTLNLNQINSKYGKDRLWTYVDYNIISKGIKAIAKHSKSSVIKEHIEQINEYCEIIDCLNVILKNNLEKNKNILNYEHDESLEDLRISDIFKKHKCSEFLTYIKTNSSELELMKPFGYNLVINQDFNNGKATLNVRFSNYVDNKTPYNLLGVQLEGNQFRIVAEKNANETANTPDKVFEEFSNNWFDNEFDKNDNCSIFGQKTSMKPHGKKKYNSYNTSNYCFVYQYFDLDEIDTNFNALYEKIKYFLKKASKILSKNFECK